MDKNVLWWIVLVVTLISLVALPGLLQMLWQEVMKQMKTDSKADFVEVIMETIKKQRRKVDGNTKSN